MLVSEVVYECVPQRCAGNGDAEIGAQGRIPAPLSRPLVHVLGHLIERDLTCALRGVAVLNVGLEGPALNERECPHHSTVVSRTA